MSDTKIILELTRNEARIITESISMHIPPKEDEMLSVMLYVRITNKLKELVKST